MIVKFFGNRGAGSPKASIDYLRGKDCKRELATVLSGDPDLTQRIAEASEFQNRYTVGCLSFEERDLPMKSKREIMDKFEDVMFAGLEKDQYSITWIEHRDKQRLELNYFIANTELTTGKRLQPYYDKADRGLTNSFCEVINYEYNLSDPHDPSRKQLIKIDKTTPKDARSFKEELTDFYIEKIQSGKITDRSQIIENLAQSGVEIARTTEKSISIKNPIDEKGRNIRLDGDIYSNEFYRDLENNRNGLPTKQDNYQKTRQESYEKSVILLETLVSKREVHNQDKYCVKNDLKKVESENEKERTFKDIREELEQRTGERERINKGNRQGIDDRPKENAIRSNAGLSENDHGSYESEVLERSGIRFSNNDNTLNDSRDDLLHMERLSREKGFEYRNSDLGENESELRGATGVGEVRIDSDNEGRGRINIRSKQEQKSRNIQGRRRSSSAENSEIKRGFYDELSGRIKEFIQRIRGGSRDAKEDIRERDRELKEWEFQADDRKQKIDEYSRESEEINRNSDERERRFDENIEFIKRVDRSNAETERKIKEKTELKISSKYFL